MHRVYTYAQVDKQTLNFVQLVSGNTQKQHVKFHIDPILQIQKH